MQKERNEKHAFTVKQLKSRKTLRELTKEFEERAAKAMENESKNALQQNALLQEGLLVIVPWYYDLWTSTRRNMTTSGQYAWSEIC